MHGLSPCAVSLFCAVSLANRSSLVPRPPDGQRYRRRTVAHWNVPLIICLPRSDLAMTPRERAMPLLKHLEQVWYNSACC